MKKHLPVQSLLNPQPSLLNAVSGSQLFGSLEADFLADRIRQRL
jgi:hypothetical protein